MGLIIVQFFMTMLFTGMIFGIGILTMIFGWGVEPKSWGWIIFGFIATWFMTFLMGAVSAIIDKSL